MRGLLREASSPPPTRPPGPYVPDYAIVYKTMHMGKQWVRITLHDTLELAQGALYEHAKHAINGRASIVRNNTDLLEYMVRGTI